MNHWFFILLILFGVFIVTLLLFLRQSLLWMSLSVLHRFTQWIAGRLGPITQDWYYKFLVKVGNRYFLKGFRDTPYHQRLIFLPFCLRPPECTARVDHSQGILCRSDCPDCQLGRVRKEAIELGYAGVYVVPSSRCLRRPDLMPSDLFIKEKLDLHEARALIGVTCCWYLKTRLLPKYSFKKEGYVAERPGPGYVLQGILLPHRKCSNATVDWALLQKRLRLKV
ncbi:MAG: DUF116 domain-containing protein [Deltaproteobacteria bacterium]|nr:DUF116 domain-containing protein [Deltaproteobacteria bacterium]